VSPIKPPWRALLLLVLAVGVPLTPTAAPAEQHVTRLLPPEVRDPEMPEAPLSPIGTPAPGGRALLFADEFDGTALDPARWSTCFWWAAPSNGCTNAGSGELGWYQPDDVLVGGGTLKLRAQRRRVTAQPSGRVYDYTSGMVSTGGIEHQRAPQFVFTYGYAEARVRVPRGRGLWPAFWMLPSTGLPTSSPSSRPEIDVTEILGHQPAVNHMNFHWWNANGTRGDRGATWTGPDFSAGWHTFAIDWRADRIVWYVDGVERWRFADAAAVPDEPMYLLLNLAVGGTPPGAPDDSTLFPAYFQVDYVRVWS
jgi:beta-glucanase (GH16 family)